MAESEMLTEVEDFLQGVLDELEERIVRDAFLDHDSAEAAMEWLRKAKEIIEEAHFFLDVMM